MLIDEIVQLLSDDSHPVTGGLLKTKVLLHKIGRPELVTWVNSELSGYDRSAAVPDYRTIGGRVVGNVSNPVMRYSHHPLPIKHLKKEIQDSLTKIELRDPIATLQDLAAGEGDAISFSLPMEITPKLSEPLGNSFGVEAAWVECSTSAIIGVISQVRSRLLDFVLNLQSAIGENMPDADLRERANKLDVTSLFNGAVFGPNAIVIFGQGNQIQTGIAPGNVEQLVKALSAVGLSTAELTELRDAIIADGKSGTADPMEGTTGHWLTKLIGRAAKGTASVGIDIASGTVAKLLAAYFGLSA